jgi:hypothetical protein
MEAAMTVEEFEKANERDLRDRANKLFQDASLLGELARTALLTEARFYLDEIDRRDDQFRSRRDFWMEFIVITLIVIEIGFSFIAFRDGKQQSAVLSNLEASSSATAKTLTALQQTIEEMNTATHEEVALSYEVALKVQLIAPDSQLEITNEGRTPVTLWGVKIADQPATMQSRPSILAPGAPHFVPAERIIVMASEEMTRTRAASIPLTLFLKNERTEDFLARYVLVSPSSPRPFRLDTQTVSVSRAAWSKRSE